MATDSQITAAVASATALGLTDAQMASLVRRAVADLLQSGRPIQSYRVAGQEFSFSMNDALKLQDYYDKRAQKIAVVALAEFN